MTKFLAIINRYEFAQFYRFGYMYISTSELLPFTEISSNETKSNLVAHFKNTTPFEYDEEYLIIHLCQEIENQIIIQKFLITDLKSIYPLSRQAKQSIQERIDTRIRLEEPIFENLIPAIISNIKNNEIEMSISALWTIFDLDGSNEIIKQKIGIENIYKGIEFREDGIKAFQTQNANIWSILIAYDRYEPFVKSTLGYFFDAGQVFAYSKNAYFEKSKLYTLLKSIKEDSNTQIIISELTNSEHSKPYISNTNFDGLKYHIIAPLYLMLKDDFRNCDDLTQSKYFEKSYFEHLKSFGDEFKAAVILLGAFFGYKKIYDLYYDKLNLSFFKKYRPIEAIENDKLTKIATIQKEEIPTKEAKTSIEIKPNDTLEIERNLSSVESEINEIIKVQKETEPIIQVETSKENTTNIIIDTEENKIIDKNETSEFVENTKIETQTNEPKTIFANPINEITVTKEISIEAQEFNLETFILDILKIQNQISLTDLKGKIKIARGDKKQITNTDLEKEINKIETLEVIKTTPKMVVRRIGLQLKLENGHQIIIPPQKA